jgi:class 3 adenylate cyclase
VRGGASDRRVTGTAPTMANARIVGILFADVVGFSSLSDIGVVEFFYHFLGEVGRMLASFAMPPLVRQTWGDGLYLVFTNVSDAGCFALDLCDMMRRVDWARENLPPDLTVRVGLHAGPLFEFVDRVTGQLTLSGKHVTRAARVEPATPPGLVYATTEFAALAAAYGVTEFTCEPVGRVNLAKGSGVASLFRVRRGEY